MGAKSDGWVSATFAAAPCRALACGVVNQWPCEVQGGGNLLFGELLI